MNLFPIRAGQQPGLLVIMGIALSICGMLACSSLKHTSKSDSSAGKLHQDTSLQLFRAIGLNKSWCTQTYKTVTGVGGDKCIELKEKKGRLFLEERSYHSHGVNYRIHGHKNQIDSASQQYEALIDTHLIQTEAWTHSAAVCRDQLIMQAIVPIDKNTWMYQVNHRTEHYTFSGNPLIAGAGTVKIRTSSRDLSGNTAYDVTYTSTETPYEWIVTFADSRGLGYRINFEAIHFPKVYQACRIGQKEGLLRYQVYHKDK